MASARAPLQFLKEMGLVCELDGAGTAFAECPHAIQIVVVWKRQNVARGEHLSKVLFGEFRAGGGEVRILLKPPGATVGMLRENDGPRSVSTHGSQEVITSTHQAVTVYEPMCVLVGGED